MKDIDFVFSSTAVRTLESKLLTKDELNRMMEAKDIEESIRVLNDTSYSNSFSKINRPEDYNKALSLETIKLYEDIEELSPYPIISYIAKLKYDLHNMKILFKDHVMGTDNTELLADIGNVELDQVRRKTEEGKRKELDNLLGGLATDAVHGYGESLDPQTIDLAVDRRFYKRLGELAEESGVEIIGKYANDYKDFSNIISLLRMKRQGRSQEYAKSVISYSGNIDKAELLSSYNDSVEEIVERYKSTDIGPRLVKGLEGYEERNSIAAFEKEFDNHIMDLAKSTKFMAFGPDVLFAYILAKEMEIKNLRIILVSKLNGLSSENIKERLRDSYV